MTTVAHVGWSDFEKKTISLGLMVDMNHTGIDVGVSSLSTI